MAIFKEVHESYDMEYRSKADDAWYNVCLVLEGGNRLRVEFENFSESLDEVFSIDDFSALNEIDEFMRRFRLSSYGVEDNECSRVIEGMMVCAEYTGDGKRRFFDAIVDSVRYKEHTPEKCLCTYLLFWQHGPEEGNITATKLHDIFLIKRAAVYPTLADFTKLLKEKLTRPATSEFILTPKRSFLSTTTNSNKNTSKSQEFGGAGHNSHVGLCEGRERIGPQLIDHDRELGGAKETVSHHYIILENLEKDVCPLLMMDFIHEQTSITAQAYVFPSLSAETYARGAIVVDSRTNLKRICEFINNPNQFIVSSSGRPWIIAEDNLRTGTFNTNLQSLQPKYENYNTKTELKVARLGTNEYNKAKKLKALYMEFRGHLNGLVQRLSTEEKKTENQSSAS